MEGCKFLQPSYKSYTEKSYKESGEPKMDSPLLSLLILCFLFPFLRKLKCRIALSFYGMIFAEIQSFTMI